MFHCVQQTEADGGANLWVDGFHVANLLYEENPEAFQILATTPVAFRNFTESVVGPMYHQSRHTLIRLVSFCVIYMCANQDAFHAFVYFYNLKS